MIGIECTYAYMIMLFKPIRLMLCREFVSRVATHGYTPSQLIKCYRSQIPISLSPVSSNRLYIIMVEQYWSGHHSQIKHEIPIINVITWAEED